MANPESLIDVNTGNSLGYQNDPAVADAVIPRVAVVAGSIELVDSTGSPLSSGQSVGASYNPLITGTYPVLLASLQNQTLVASAYSPAFDPRPFANFTFQWTCTAASGGATITPILEVLEPATGTWWWLKQGATIAGVSGSQADGAIAGNGNALFLFSQSNEASRPMWPQTRVWWEFGGAGAITLSIYLWGF